MSVILVVIAMLLVAVLAAEPLLDAWPVRSHKLRPGSPAAGADEGR